jgi:aryl-alcohol dehydrogenase-like predicted oxidoreductase
VYRNVSDDRYHESGLADWVAANDVGVAFFSPLRHGLLLGLFEGPVTFGAGDHRNDIPDFRDVALLHQLSACRGQLESRFAGKTEPVLHGLVGALLTGAPTGSVVLGQHRPSQVVAAATTGEALSEEDANWVRNLYGENGRSKRGAWRSDASDSTAD